MEKHNSASKDKITLQQIESHLKDMKLHSESNAREYVKIVGIATLALIGIYVTNSLDHLKTRKLIQEKVENVCTQKNIADK